MTRWMWAMVCVVVGCDGSPEVRTAKDVGADEGPGSETVVIGLPDALAETSDSTGLCAALADGDYCDQGVLIACVGGEIAGSKACEGGCLSTPGDLPDVCAEAAGGEDPCAGQPDGPLCSLGALLTCAGGATVTKQACPLGCLTAPEAHCVQPVGEDVCAAKADGVYCVGDALISCQDGAVTAEQACALGCVPAPAGEAQLCASEVEAGFCDGLSDGGHCNGDWLTSCADGAVIGQQECLHGCVEVPGVQSDLCGPGGSEGEVEACEDCPEFCQSIPPVASASPPSPSSAPPGSSDPSSNSKASSSSSSGSVWGSVAGASDGSLKSGSAWGSGVASSTAGSSFASAGAGPQKAAVWQVAPSGQAVPSGHRPTTTARISSLPRG